MLIAFSSEERVSEEPDKFRLFCCTEPYAASIWTSFSFGMRRTWGRSSQGSRITSIKRGYIKGWPASHPTKLPVSHRHHERAYTIITGNLTPRDYSSCPLLRELEFAMES